MVLITSPIPTDLEAHSIRTKSFENTSSSDCQVERDVSEWVSTEKLPFSARKNVYFQMMELSCECIDLLSIEQTSKNQQVLSNL